MCKNQATSPVYSHSSHVHLNSIRKLNAEKQLVVLRLPEFLIHKLSTIQECQCCPPDFSSAMKNHPAKNMCNLEI